MQHDFNLLSTCIYAFGLSYRDQMRSSNPDLSEDQQYYKELQKERDEVETELEIIRPLINLVDNLVRMGSLYGGQNELIAQEFYKVSL